LNPLGHPYFPMKRLGIPKERLGLNPLGHPYFPKERLGIPKERLGIPKERLGIPKERLGLNPLGHPYFQAHAPYTRADFCLIRNLSTSFKCGMRRLG